MSQQKPILKIYCECCDSMQEFIICPLVQHEDCLEYGYWGDIICKRCNFVIATLSSTEEGEYEILFMRFSGR